MSSTSSSSSSNSGNEKYIAPAPDRAVMGYAQAIDAFALLSDKEKQYAFHLTRAAWAAAPILAHQVSSEAPLIVEMMIRLFKAGSLEKLQASVDADNWTHFLIYTSMISDQGANYKGFGDIKFIPRLPQDQFEAIVSASGDSRALHLWHQCRERVYSLERKELRVANSGYYWPEATLAELEPIDAALQAAKISAQNTEIRKVADGQYEVLVASIEERTVPLAVEGDQKVTVRYGNYRKQLEQMVAHLKRASEFAANEKQVKMLRQYVSHFTTGDYDKFWNSQRTWVTDVGPAVETNIGYVETYRDPKGIRAEFELFVATVNRKRSEIFANLVKQAPELIVDLPWGDYLKKDTFQSPDFTSLDILAFMTSGSPSGINIPNNNLIRQEEGFKNVALGNIMGAKVTKRLPLLSREDEAFYNEWNAAAYEVQVGLHELLGHGSGKLLSERPDGTLNFDDDEIKAAGSYYKNGETYNTVFGPLASTIEECRADSVGIYMCDDSRVAATFGTAVTKEGDVADVVYANYLSNALQGLRALSFWSEEKQKITQAHIRGRFAILRTLVDAGEGLVTISTHGEDGIVLSLDRSKILSVGKPAIGKLLNRLMVMRGTADVSGGGEWYKNYTTPDDYWRSLLPRVVAQEAKIARKVIVLPNVMQSDDGKLYVKEYEPTPLGGVLSFIDRYAADQPIFDY